MQNKDYPRLLNCPFCGGIPAVVEDGYKAIAVHCFNCGADITAESEKKARAAWNRRAQPANEPQPLENGFDITNADGTPVDYNALGQKYKDQLCYCDIDQFYIGEDGELVLMDDCGKAVSVDRGDYHIEARPPERSENDA